MKYADYLENIVMPDRIRALPICPVKKIPIPWFVAEVDGKRDFRVADSGKIKRAILEDLCWVCGEKLGVYRSFVIGPMCVINRVSSEPPSHLACAQFSVKACPFLSRPSMERREENLPENAECAGIMIKRNPGVSCIWTSKKNYYVLSDMNGLTLFTLRDPDSVTMWAQGRIATKQEVINSIESGLPTLREMCDDINDHYKLNTAVLNACHLLKIDAHELKFK